MIIEQNEANNRLIKQSQYVACTEAFLDCRIPGSIPKSNYSLIGPGVTQNKSQVINLKEPHGFNIGAAAMPNGVTNNLHVHFTAEVFMCIRGKWLFRWGPKGEQGTYLAKAGDIFSVPTWIFRGFTNVGDDNGWLFTCLGGDNTGGVIWSPDIMRAANESGLYLSENNELIDVTKGQALAEGERFITPFPQDAIEELRVISPEEMATRISTNENRRFSEKAFLDFSIDGHGCALAPIIGYGLTQDRNQHPLITNPHGFSIEYLKIAPGKSLGSFRIKEKMVVINIKGQLNIEYNQGRPGVSVTMGAEDTCSVPGDVWRKFVNTGNETVEVLVIISGDARKYPEFSDEVMIQSEENGWLLDASHYLVKKGLTVRNTLLEK
ncbi:TPA: cupin [Salmonella enterica]|nr:cupin domain-containing protein [Salmonella enterica]OIN18477.1 hypothetical protein AO411_2019870 [Salmonella enterica subsp. enterica serovar Sarajane]EBR1020964.1 cupin domain-containing protein [Salmonella enterica]EGL7634251.1 cupin domain-containing protein [Salmonella enterica]EGL8402761.1 cupin domain-containing protein [Salmonella enterica]